MHGFILFYYIELMGTFTFTLKNPSDFLKDLKLKSSFAFMETLHLNKEGFYIWKTRDLLEFPVKTDFLT